MPLIRYPGSKAKLVEAIVSQFPPQMRMPLWMDAGGWEYREPFFGSGAIGIAVLEMLPPRCSAWINDKDLWLYRLWQAVLYEPKRLCKMIGEFEPTPERFYEFKMQDGDPGLEPVKAGFRKLALHLMSWSGLGAKAGGPLGGKDQGNAKYPVDCRWNPEFRQNEILELHELFKSRRVKITNLDFTAMLDGGADAFVYADPPYWDKGPELYKHAFTVADHKRLAAALRKYPGKWAVSYDDHPEIRSLYSGFKIVPVDVKYSVAVESETRRKNQEILIVSEGATVSA